MSDLEPVLNLYSASLKDVVEAVAPIPESAMILQPAGLVNHPAWTLSHLAHAAAFITTLLDEPCDDVGDNDMERYGPGSVPIADSSKYATKAQLISRLARRHEIVERVVRAKHQDYFAKAPPAPFVSFAPTVGRIIVYLLAAHESYHLGQLMDWKRSANLT